MIRQVWARCSRQRVETHHQSWDIQRDWEYISHRRHWWDILELGVMERHRVEDMLGWGRVNRLGLGRSCRVEERCQLA